MKYFGVVKQAFEFGDSCRPTTAPQGWMLPVDDHAALFSGHISHRRESGLHDEEGCHYYGRPVMLFEHYILFSGIGEDRMENGLLIAHRKMVVGQTMQSSCFDSTWFWELHSLNRNPVVRAVFTRRTG